MRHGGARSIGETTRHKKISNSSLPRLLSRSCLSSSSFFSTPAYQYGPPSPSRSPATSRPRRRHSGNRESGSHLSGCYIFVPSRWMRPPLRPLPPFFLSLPFLFLHVQKGTPTAPFLSSLFPSSLVRFVFIHFPFPCWISCFSPLPNRRLPPCTACPLLSIRLFIALSNLTDFPPPVEKFPQQQNKPTNTSHTKCKKISLRIRMPHGAKSCTRRTGALLLNETSEEGGAGWPMNEPSTPALRCREGNLLPSFLKLLSCLRLWPCGLRCHIPPPIPIPSSDHTQRTYTHSLQTRIALSSNTSLHRTHLRPPFFPSHRSLFRYGSLALPPPLA